MVKESTISVIVPVYNEESAILQTLDDINKTLEDFLQNEIIVVNDGSTDTTLDKVRESNIKNLRIINHIENLGYGRSLSDGIMVAKYNCIAIIDGDGSYPAEMIKHLYDYYPQYDMIVGARKGKEYKRGIFKRLSRILFSYSVAYVIGKKVPDVNSGLRIFKKDVVMRFQHSFCTGFSFTTVLTLFFFLNHYYVKYVPIDYAKRKGKSKVSHFKDTLRSTQIIAEAVLYYNPLKLFLLLAALSSIFGIILEIVNYSIFRIDFLSILSAIFIASFFPIFGLGLIANQIKQVYKSNKME